MQAMGAYGFRGFYQQKTHFLQSVPYAIQNLEWLLRGADILSDLPHLTKTIQKIIQSTLLRQFGHPSLTLTVRIQSFSYKQGIPRDDKGHGGGFVFDCRALPNPQLCPEFRSLTGSDPSVMAYLDKQPEVQNFLRNTEAILDQTIKNYKSRNFFKTHF